MNNTFTAAQAWLKELSSEAKFFRETLDQELTAVNAILDALGRPDKKFQHRIIIGGTAGKGTTTRYIEQALENYGKTTALISSPHIQVITERIRIGGRLISMEDFGEYVLKVREVVYKLRNKKEERRDAVTPTYYEAIVLAGILAASEAGAEILICEVGIGGEFDAVNAVQGPRMAAVTFIGDDHLEMFGNSPENLARAKAGIFTSDSVYNVSYEKNFRDVFRQVELELRKKKEEIDISPPLPKGEHRGISEKQEAGGLDFLTGIKAKMSKKIAKKICEKVLGHPVVMTPVKLPCRWEKIAFNPTFLEELRKKKEERRDEDSSTNIPPDKGAASNLFQKQEAGGLTLILDGAHSAPRFEYILPKIKKLTGRKTAILGMLKNHDPESFRIILDEFDEVIWTDFPADREIWDPSQLMENFGRGVIANSPEQALTLALKSSEKIVITGSFQLCREVRNLFYAPEKILEQGNEFY